MGIYDLLKLSESLEHTRKTLMNLPMGYMSAVSESLKSYHQIHEQLKFLRTPTIIKTIQKQQELARQLTPFFHLMSQQGSLLSNIAPQIAIISEAMKPYLALKDFSQIGNKWLQIDEILSKQRANSILLDNYWLIIDNELFESIKEESKNRNFDVNKFIVKYYSNHKFENISKILESIIDYKCVSATRIKILKDCHIAMKKLSCSVACNIVIPVITAQTDGILADICKLIPEEFIDSLKQEEKIKKNSSTATIILCYLETLMAGKTVEQFKLVIKEKAFGKQKKNQKYRKSRHGILHGNCNYGSKENLVRAWLELAFISKIYCLIINIQNDNDKL